MQPTRFNHVIMEDGVECKRCCRCHRWKPLKDFNRDPENPDGLRYVCKKCNQAYMKAYHRAHPRHKTPILHDIF